MIDIAEAFIEQSIIPVKAIEDALLEQLGLFLPIICE
jgi:hypothetical protein